MIFFLALTIYAYIRFKKLRYKYVFAFAVLLYYLYISILGNSQLSGGHG